MAPLLPPLTTLSDAELCDTRHRLATRERHATAALVASLGEVDVRRLYLGEGCSSLFTYCTRVLHLSEHVAYNRIEAARAARRFPIILERLAHGSATLTTVRLLAPHLTPENHLALLDAARHASKHDVERLVATLRPKPAMPATVRKLPVRVAAGPAVSSTEAEPHRVVPSAAPTTAAPTPTVPAPAPTSQRRLVQPLAPSRYKVQLTLDDEGVALLRRAQALMRNRMPDGDMAAVVTEGLRLLVEQLEKTKAAATARPQSKSRSLRRRSRTIPAAVRRAVWRRDEGRCAFIGTQGRCTETAFLEFHHVQPYAEGGSATVENIELRCRAHNQYEAEQCFGAGLPWRVRESASVRVVETRSGTSPELEFMKRRVRGGAWVESIRQVNSTGATAPVC